MKQSEIESLVSELEAIRNYLTPPPPDPNVWPPAGWTRHPTIADSFVCTLTEKELRNQLFGNAEIDEWKRLASIRKSEIEEVLQKLFFPKPKDEGTERKALFGFAAMLKTGLERKVDKEALPAVLEALQLKIDDKKLGIEAEKTLIRWTPAVETANYRKVPSWVRKDFENALVIKPTKTNFEIVRVEPIPES